MAGLRFCFPSPAPPSRTVRAAAGGEALTVMLRPGNAGSDTASALRPGGRLVTTITGTGLIITADKTPDGGAAGCSAWDRAGFMHTRTGPDYPPGLLEQFAVIRDAEGEQVSAGRYPVVNVPEAWP